MAKLLFIRHGQTRANATGHWQGWSDPPLTAHGRSQAEAVDRRLTAEKGQIKAVYTSPLRRASQTAQAIGATLGLQPTPVDQLKEIHFGQLEGVTLQEMEARFPALFARWQDKRDMTFHWPGGERRSDFFSRVAGACQLILARHPDDKVVIVAHGGTIRACLAELLPREMGEWWTYSLDNGGLTRVHATGSNARLLVLNDAGHVPTPKDQ
jgi:broad specificity phosphatase PhoE